MHHIFIAGCAVVGSVAVATAQTTTTPGSAQTPQSASPVSPTPGTTQAPAGQSAQQAPAAQGSQSGMTTVNPSSVRVTFYTVKPTEILTSRLKGADVRNLQNETVGEIDDFVIDDGKTIRAVILSVGGFLGIGERRVAVEPNSLVITRQGDEVRATLNTNKEDLKNAPEFKMNR